MSSISSIFSFDSFKLKAFCTQSKCSNLNKVLFPSKNIRVASNDRLRNVYCLEHLWWQWLTLASCGQSHLPAFTLQFILTSPPHGSLQATSAAGRPPVAESCSSPSKLPSHLTSVRAREQEAMTHSVEKNGFWVVVQINSSLNWFICGFPSLHCVKLSSGEMHHFCQFSSGQIYLLSFPLQHMFCDWF